MISVWELGVLEAKGRLRLQLPCDQWIGEALAAPGLSLDPLTSEIALDSNRLRGTFHGDPADELLWRRREAAVPGCFTRDEKMIEYARQRHIAIV